MTTSAGTNEDEIYIIADRKVHVWQDPAAPVFIRADQALAASLGILLVVYSFWAYTVRRYTNSHQKIGSTGMITPDVRLIGENCAVLTEHHLKIAPAIYYAAKTRPPV